MNDGPRKKFWLRPWMIIILALAAALVYNYWPISTTIIPSRETTYVIGPLNPDGTVNYVEHLNRKYSRGVTAENNAAPLLLRAFGPDFLPEETRDETLRQLGMTAEDLDRDKHFVPWRDRARPTTAPATMADQSDAASLLGDEDDDEGPDLDEVFDMLREGKIDPELDAWLAENAAPLDLVLQATKKERVYLPMLSASDPPRLIEAMIPNCWFYMQAARALGMRSMVKAIRGDIRGAWEDNLTCHRLARCVPTRYLIGLMWGTGIENIAAKNGIALATRYPMPPRQAKSVLKSLSELKPVGDLVESINDGERLMALDVVMMMSRGMSLDELTGKDGSGDEGMSFNLDWNRMLRQLNPFYDRIIKDLTVADIRERKRAVDAFGTHIKTLAGLEAGSIMDVEFKFKAMALGGRLFRGALTDRCTNLLMAILAPALYQCTVVRDRSRQMRDIETLAVALAGFHAEHGRWPAKLNELCPAYIPSVPADVFTLDPLVYKPGADGYLLYSLGDNLRDDGGKWDEHLSGSEREHDDIGAQVGTAASTSQPAE